MPPRDEWMVRSVDYVARTSVPPTSIVPTARDELARMDSELAMANVRTLEEVEREDRAQTAFTMLMLAIAAGVGLLLGAVGLYGVISYATARRTREIGIRLALGADGGSVRGMVFRQGFTVTALGLAVGVFGAWAATPFLESLLRGVSPTDPLTYGVVALTITLVSAAAVWLPARRASSVGVVEELRTE